MEKALQGLRAAAETFDQSLEHIRCGLLGTRWTESDGVSWRISDDFVARATKALSDASTAARAILKEF